VYEVEPGENQHQTTRSKRQRIAAAAIGKCELAERGLNGATGCVAAVVWYVYVPG
jgi:hypothetical protein